MRHSSSDSSSNKSHINQPQKSESLAFLEKKKIEELNNKLKLENRVKSAIYAKNNNNSFGDVIPLKKPETTDSRFTNFVRGFRRENTDFFPQSKRHSAIFGEQSVTITNLSPQIQQRSSAIFQRNRSQTKGEPILTDYNSNRDATLINRAKLTASLRTRNSSFEQQQQQAQPQQQKPTGALSSSASSSAVVVVGGVAPPPPPAAGVSKNLDFLRMRREKTESVIFVSRNSEARQQLLLNQQVMAWFYWESREDFFFF